jgi:hypothetical protein
LAGPNMLGETDCVVGQNLEVRRHLWRVLGWGEAWAVS